MSYGEQIFAVGNGVVVSAINDQPDQIPGAFPSDLSENAPGGNSVVLDLSGRYAYYAHMQPGSVWVKAGDVVSSGDLIGRLGNSGKSIGPHPHFHVMEAASYGATGLPYVFSSFVGLGVLAPNGLLLSLPGKTAPVLREQIGPRSMQHPLNNQIVSFD